MPVSWFSSFSCQENGCNSTNLGMIIQEDSNNPAAYFGRIFNGLGSGVEERDILVHCKITSRMGIFEHTASR
jgi:hypothetical protein